MRSSAALSIIQFLLILLFVYTGLSKLLDIKSLAGALHAVPFMRPFAKPLSIGLPVTELILAILLTIPGTLQKALYISLGLLIVFTIYLSWMVLTTDDLPYSCGGVLQQMSWKQHIIFNIAFITFNVLAIFLAPDNKKLIAINRLDVQQANPFNYH